MSQNLIAAAVRAGIVLSDVIDAMIEDEQLSKDPDAMGLRAELCGAYATLVEAISCELDLDARELLRTIAASELETARAILTAQTGFRFPIGSKE